MEEMMTIPSFYHASLSANQNERRRGKKQGMCATMKKEQCLLALYISLHCVPFSKKLQFEGDAENTEENTLKAEKNPRTKFYVI